MCDIKVENFKDIDIKAATEIILDSYEKEKRDLPYLPEARDYRELLSTKLKHLASEGKGIIALEDDELIGFLAGYKVDDLYGNCKGIYTPVYGHGNARKGKSRIYQELYRNAAENWVEEGFISHAVSFSVTTDPLSTRSFGWVLGYDV